MISRTYRAASLAMLLVCLASASAARGEPVTTAYLSAVTAMVTEQGQRSAHDAALIREFYAPYIAPLALDAFSDIEVGLATGGLVPLPLDPSRFNIRVRLDGPNPIGQMDLAHQSSYLAARAATIGCLLDVASRVKSGPIEVTSLVRHLEYQEQLRTTNLNATTDVPTHALGLAFDIAMVNSPLPTVLELRDVLQRMSDAGDILAIVERQQLVFHVVPQPARLGWYTQVYANAIAGQPWVRASDDGRALTPVVTTAFGALRPLPAWSAEWWAADNVPVDLPMVTEVAISEATSAAPRGLVNRCFSFVGDLLSATWRPLSAAFNAKT